MSDKQKARKVARKKVATTKRTLTNKPGGGRKIYIKNNRDSHVLISYRDSSGYQRLLVIEDHIEKKDVPKIALESEEMKLLYSKGILSDVTKKDISEEIQQKKRDRVAIKGKAINPANSNTVVLEVKDVHSFLSEADRTRAVYPGQKNYEKLDSVSRISQMGEVRGTRSSEPNENDSWENLRQEFFHSDDIRNNSEFLEKIKRLKDSQKTTGDPYLDEINQKSTEEYVLGLALNLFKKQFAEVLSSAVDKIKSDVSEEVQKSVEKKVTKKALLNRVSLSIEKVMNPPVEEETEGDTENKEKEKIADTLRELLKEEGIYGKLGEEK